jgi:glycosyltransferase involved in cell wall biosynthesis
VNAPAVSVSVSVLMPMRDAAEFLPQAIASLRAQDFADFEVVGVDDGSADETARLFTELGDERFRLVAGPARGISAALNAGLDVARAALVARMDADDECHPDRLRMQTALLSANPRLVAVASAYDVVDAHGTVERTQVAPLDDLCTRGMLLSHNPFGHGSVMFRRDAMRASGGYRTDDEPAEDYAAWRRLAEQGEFAAAEQPLYRHRTHGGQVSVAQADPQRAAAIELAAVARAQLTLAPIAADDVRASGVAHVRAGAAYRRLFVVAMRELSLELVRRRRWREAAMVRRCAADVTGEAADLRSRLRLAKAAVASRRRAGR